MADGKSTRLLYFGEIHQKIKVFNLVIRTSFVDVKHVACVKLKVGKRGIALFYDGSKFEIPFKGEFEFYYIYTRKNAQLVTNPQQTCSKLVGASLLQDLFELLVPACWQVATSLMNSTALLQVVPTIIVIGLQVNKL